MNIFDFAMQKEKDAEAFYRDLAERSNSKGLNNIYTHLADAESKHCAVVKHMKEHKSEPAYTNIMDDVATVFNKMSSNKDELLKLDRQQVRVYEKAREIEKESIDLYTAKANETENPEHKQILQQLAEQEKMHYAIVDQLVEAVLIPETWVENGEFSHILEEQRGDAYYPDSF
ncbi:MAG: ferritin family protein [Lentisphaeria bacterium]